MQSILKDIEREMDDDTQTDLKEDLTMSYLSDDEIGRRLRDLRDPTPTRGQDLETQGNKPTGEAGRDSQGEKAAAKDYLPDADQLAAEEVVNRMEAANLKRAREELKAQLEKEYEARLLGQTAVPKASDKKMEDVPKGGEPAPKKTPKTAKKTPKKTPPPKEVEKPAPTPSAVMEALAGVSKIPTLATGKPSVPLPKTTSYRSSSPFSPHSHSPGGTFQTMEGEVKDPREALSKFKKWSCERHNQQKLKCTEIELHLHKVDKQLHERVNAVGQSLDNMGNTFHAENEKRKDAHLAALRMLDHMSEAYDNLLTERHELNVTMGALKTELGQTKQELEATKTELAETKRAQSIMQRALDSLAAKVDAIPALQAEATGTKSTPIQFGTFPLPLLPPSPAMQHPASGAASGNTQPTAPVGNPYSFIKPPAPPIYNPLIKNTKGVCQDVSTWIAQVTQFFELGELPKDKYIKMGPTYLGEGPFGSWLTQKKEWADKDIPVTWENFTKFLRATFEPSNMRDMQIDALKALKRGDLTMQAYHQQFKILQGKIEGEPLSQAELLMIFRDQMDPALRYKVDVDLKTVNHTNFDAFVAAAFAVETLFYQDPARTEPAKAPTYFAPPSSSRPPTDPRSQMKRKGADQQPGTGKAPRVAYQHNTEHTTPPQTSGYGRGRGRFNNGRGGGNSRPRPEPETRGGATTDMATPLSVYQQEHNLCFICSSPDHTKRTCPVYHANRKAAQAAWSVKQTQAPVAPKTDGPPGFH